MSKETIDFDAAALDWSKGPLLPAIVQDAATAQVLMLGYMNEAAVARTCSSGLVTFFSRSRQTLWTKGETSGNVLHCQALYPDCDGDTLLVLAMPDGPTCHRNTVSCFDEPKRDATQFLGQLERVVRARLNSGGADSYVASLKQRGIERIAQKVGEEGVELAIAAVSGNADGTLNEAADLLFHLLVLINHEELTLSDVVAALKQRS